MTMECREARRLLAIEIKTLPESVRGDVRAHVAGCVACQTLLDRFGAAVLSMAAEEIPCAECQSWLDRYVALELAGADASRQLDLVHAHLNRCPECADDRRFLLAGLRALHSGRLPEPAAYPRFNTGFARETPVNARRGPAPWWAPLSRILERGRALLSGLQTPWLSRGAWGALAAMVVIAFAALIAVRPDLRERVTTLMPGSGPDRAFEATATAAAAATQTMASAMGHQWDESAGGTATAASADGRSTAGALATPTLNPTESAAQRLRLRDLAATREARDTRNRGARLTPTLTVTPTQTVTITPTVPPATPESAGQPQSEPVAQPTQAPEEPTGVPEPTKAPDPTTEPKDPYP